MAGSLKSILECISWYVASVGCVRVAKCLEALTLALVFLGLAEIVLSSRPSFTRRQILPL